MEAEVKMEQLARRNAVAKEEEVTRTSWSGIWGVGSLKARGRVSREGAPQNEVQMLEQRQAEDALQNTGSCGLRKR